jgi:hypothetical protein
MQRFKVVWLMEIVQKVYVTAVNVSSSVAQPLTAQDVLTIAEVGVAIIDVSVLARVLEEEYVLTAFALMSNVVRTATVKRVVSVVESSVYSLSLVSLTMSAPRVSVVSKATVRRSLCVAVTKIALMMRSASMDGAHLLRNVKQRRIAQMVKIVSRVGVCLDYVEALSIVRRVRSVRQEHVLTHLWPTLPASSS